MKVLKKLVLSSWLKFPVGKEAYFGPDIFQVVGASLQQAGNLHLLASMGGGAVDAGSLGDESDKVWVFQVGLKEDSGGRHIYEHGCWVLVPRLGQGII